MSYDAAELNRKLLDRFEEVCQHLLPNGKKKGHHWMVGAITGEAGDSLQITLSGSAAGRFLDFSDKEIKGATPLWLWAKVRGIAFPQAIKEACDFLGVQESDYGVKRHRPKTYERPVREDISYPEGTGPIVSYLIEQRKIDPAVVSRFKIGETADKEDIVFNFAEWDTEANRWICVHRKYLKVDRPEGKKIVRSSKGTKRCLYGKQVIDENVSEIVICEGEIDALTWHSYGIPAVSVPNGVSDMEWMDIDWEWLARFERIYVSMDMDDPGRQATTEICKRLGLHRCYIVELPHKDANECLLAGVKREDMEKCIASAKQIELDEIKHPTDFKKEVVDFYTTDPSDMGASTPWYPELPWRVRPGELTVLSGFAGHGKTQLLNQLMIHLIQQGLKIMDASLEIRAGMTLYYMTRCALAKKNATKEEAEACVEWLNDNLYFLDCIGTVNVDRIMHAMEYSRKRHGTNVFVIDSLFKCGMSGEDFAGAREFMDRLTTFCNNTGAHVILVAHSRKTQNGNEYAVPTKSDVAGSSDITNAAFNVIIAWRHKMKKRKMDEARQEGNVEELTKWMDQHDGKIMLDKQRFGEGEECEVYTWFHRDSCQFHTTPGKYYPIFQLK